MELKVTLDDESIEKLKDLIVKVIREEWPHQPKPHFIPPGALPEVVSPNELRDLVRKANVAVSSSAGKAEARKAIVGVLKDSGAESITQLKESEYAIVAEKLKGIIDGG